MENQLLSFWGAGELTQASTPYILPWKQSFPEGNEKQWQSESCYPAKDNTAIGLHQAHLSMKSKWNISELI